MNIQTAINELSKKLGPPKPRVAFGQWVPLAWLVRGLVEKGYGVTDAVRHVLDNSGMGGTRNAFGSLRAAYYKIKDKEWPASVTSETTDEEFE